MTILQSNEHNYKEQINVQVILACRARADCSNTEGSTLNNYIAAILLLTEAWAILNTVTSLLFVRGGLT